MWIACVTAMIRLERGDGSRWESQEVACAGTLPICLANHNKVLEQHDLPFPKRAGHQKRGQG